MDVNNILSELAQYTRLQEETTAIIDGLKDTLKKYMDENHLETLTGTEHKATYKAVASSRIDTTALKKDMPDIAAQYTKSTSTKRFLFN